MFDMDGIMETAVSYTHLDVYKRQVLAYGNFLTILINFLILAFVIFQMVKMMNRMKKAEPPAAPAPTPDDIVLLREIRDALKK